MTAVPAWDVRMGAPLRVYRGYGIGRPDWIRVTRPLTRYARLCTRHTS